MSRNRYTKLVRKEQRAQLERQEKELAVIRRSLHRAVIEQLAPPAAETKQRRRVRLERRRQDKPAHYAAANQMAATQEDRLSASVEVAA